MNRKTAIFAAYWLSEALGEPVTARDVRLRDGWLFHIDRDYINRYGYDDAEGVDCIPYDPDNLGMYAEPWDCVSYNMSPFSVRDADTIKALTDGLSAAYADYCKEYNIN